MKKMPKVSVNSILLGQDLSELLEMLNYRHDTGGRLIVILLAEKGVELASTGGISYIEALGALTVALDQVQRRGE